MSEEEEEEKKVEMDRLIYGQGFMKNGKRIDPKEVFPVKVHVLIMITHGHITVMGLYESQGEAINAAQTIETLVEGKIVEQKDLVLLEFIKGLDENQIQCNVPNSETTYLIQSL